MKKTPLTFILVLAFISTTFAQINRENIDKLPLPWIQFNWQGDSLAHRYFDKAAITIPVKIDDLPYNFNMQLDLGAVTTMFYGKPIASFMKLSSDLNNKLDTTQKPVYINSRACPLFHHIDLTLDKILFRDLSVACYTNFGDNIPTDSAQTLTSKHIGTIAPDLFQNSILLIDYLNQRICSVDSLPKEIAKKANFVPVKIKDGRIKIPFTIGSDEYNIMFDTGSSIFSIFSSVENSALFTNPMQPAVDSLIGEQWGQKIKVYGKKITKKITLGKHKMPPAMIYYLEDKSQKQFESEEHIAGVTGNAYFLQNIIIIDYRNSKFGVL